MNTYIRQKLLFMKIKVTQNLPGASTQLTSHLNKVKAMTLLSTFLFFFCLSSVAQNNITVKGRIINEKNEPVVGASVVVMGTNNGTATSANGDYSISAPATGTLVISSVGYPSKEIEINRRTNINISLTTSTTDLQQVVVVGYGTQRKEAVTGSVASISGNAMREVPSSNITQALQGRLPGVDISQTSSQPGSTMQIRIRGTRSLTGNNDPLIVLDGIPFAGNIGDINPNDVQSIDILKDASATAIYGSRGANGVILITTVKGTRGRKPVIAYNAYYGRQNIFAKYPMMNAQQLLALRKAAGIYPTPGTDEDTTGNTNTDWQSLFYRPGMVTSHDINLSGGTEQGSYSFGLGYYLNQAVIPTQQYNRYSFRASIDQNVGKYFRLGFTTYDNYNQSQGNQVGLYNILSMSPLINPYNPDGSLKRTVKMPLDEQYVLTRNRVDSLDNAWLSQNRGYASYNSVFGEVRIPWVQGLKYRVNLGLDFIQNNSGNFTGQGVNNVNPITVSTAGTSNSQTSHWTIENLLTYDRTIAGKHNINVVALYSTEQSKYNSSSASAQNISNEQFQFYNLGATLDQNSINLGGSYNARGLESLMGRVMYSYNNRYMLSATVRSDASSVLAPGHQWHTYPAISAGWNIGRESFMQNITWINSLKLRAGFGQTSNQAVQPYQTLGSLGTRPYNFGPSTYATGYYVTQSPNPELGWEYSKTYNYGVDFALLNNRLSGTVEYYVTNTNDLLQNVALPATAGVGYFTGNVGQTQNKGWEFSLNGTIINNKNGLSWDAGVNLYTNHNKIVALASGAQQDIGNSWFVGHNINAIFDYQYTGLWSKADPYMSILEPGGKVGMVKVKYTGGYDPTGKPLRAIGPDDRQILDIDPKFQGGFNTRVSYKGFDFTAVAAFKSGGILVSTLYGPGGYLNMMSGRRNNVVINYWTPSDTTAKFPNPAGPYSGDFPKYMSTLGYFDASYLKIRSLTLGYNFSHSLIKNSDVKLRMYVTAENPFVFFSPYYNMSKQDPEPNSYGDQNQAVSSYQHRVLVVGFNTPSTRNYIVGLNLTF
jgi:TonB-dependent starch-binding outer membrane protein SusC